ncbi:agamous-like MADS-box protein AGL29 [Aristolochia californica]|uniref:agamous-like MADS-box protein AGL29 n=1 Tax=Aristolochia californica TaxID=171875 RepID=UPI0035E1F2A1
MGKQKMEMKKIEDPKSLQATFSRRQKGLFKKASDLSTLCGVSVFAIVLSPGGKPCVMSSDQNPGALIQTYLGKKQDQVVQSQENSRNADFCARFGIDDKAESSSHDMEELKDSTISNPEEEI